MRGKLGESGSVFQAEATNHLKPIQLEAEVPCSVKILLRIGIMDGSFNTEVCLASFSLIFLMRVKHGDRLFF